MGLKDADAIAIRPQLLIHLEDIGAQVVMGISSDV